MEVLELFIYILKKIKNNICKILYKMIIWLASYPKSGNTLLRSILGTYFFSNDGIFDFKYTYRIGQFPVLDYFKRVGVDITNDKEIFRNYIKAQDLFNKENKSVKFFKTHSTFFDRKTDNAKFSNLKNTLGAIYVVRDPRSIVSSFAHHYQLSINEATDQICNKDLFSKRTEIHPHTFMSSWKLNYLSWKSLGNKVLIIKYEDLTGEKKKKILLKIFDYFKTLGMSQKSFNITKLNKVIKSTEFNKMKELEKKRGFREATIDEKTGKSIPFFNKGPKNKWQEVLDENNQKKIEKEFEKEMLDLGYL